MGNKDSNQSSIRLLLVIIAVLLALVLIVGVLNLVRQIRRDSRGGGPIPPTAVAREPTAVLPTVAATAVPPTAPPTDAPATATRPRPTATSDASDPAPTPPGGPVRGQCGAAAVACTELGGFWSGGNASCRPDGTGYDTSACVPLKQPDFETVIPAERDPDRWGSARCNDGTPFAFQVRLSTTAPSTKWVIQLEGGGWCDDDSKRCLGRTPDLTSERVGRDTSFADLNKSGIFNQDPQANPTFYDANHVFAPYCSSDLWSGSTADRRPTLADPNGWYFTGRLNVAAMVESLMHAYGLDDENPDTQVLFTGTSAGGIGVEVNADTFTRRLPQASAADRVKLVNDGGLILDWDNPDYRLAPATEPIRDLMARNYEFWGSSLNPLCEEAMIAQGLPPGRCFMTEVVYPYIVEPPPAGLGLPLLIQVSLLDQPATQGHGIDDPNDPNDRAALAAWREQTLETIQQFNWVFSGGRPYHTLLTRDDPRNGWAMGASGETFRDVLTRFWNGEPRIRVISGN